MAEPPPMPTPILLVKGAELIVRTCAGVSPGDRCLVISDHTRWAEGQAVAGAALASGGVPILADVSSEVARFYSTGQRPEPPDHMAAAFAASTFVFAVVDVEYSHLLGHTAKNQAAQEGGMQYVIVEEGMAGWTTTQDDIEEFVARTFRVSELLRRAAWVNVSSAAGTDATFKVKPGRRVWSFGAKTSCRREALIAPNYGETACVPWEGSTEGRAIVDGYIQGLGPVTEPVELVIRGGRVIEVNGGPSAERVRAMIATAGENADNIGEFGICTSHKERRPYEYQGTPGHFSYGAWGTAHFAIGHSRTIGGEVDSKIHSDCQMYDPTVVIDDTVVMESGVYRI